METTTNQISPFNAVKTFMKVGTCSETLCNVINRAFGEPLVIEEKATMLLAGGIMQHGYQCGFIWGSALAAGAEAYRKYGSGPKAEQKAIIAAQRLVEAFRKKNGTINCYDITECDKSSTPMQMIVYFLIKGGTIGCFKRAAKYAPTTLDEISIAFNGDGQIDLDGPISCTATLAKKMGLTDLQISMAAGLAGGIGLSGGGCGALGAAIWIMGLEENKEGKREFDFKDPKVFDKIEQFLKRSDYKFECSEIVGRKFKDIEDHSEYIKNGGCKEIIEALAS